MGIQCQNSLNILLQAGQTYSNYIHVRQVDMQHDCWVVCDHFRTHIMYILLTRNLSPVTIPPQSQWNTIQIKDLLSASTSNCDVDIIQPTAIMLQSLDIVSSIHGQHHSTIPATACFRFCDIHDFFMQACNMAIFSSPVYVQLYTATSTIRFTVTSDLGTIHQTYPVVLDTKSMEPIEIVISIRSLQTILPLVNEQSSVQCTFSLRGLEFCVDTVIHLLLRNRL